MDSLPDGTDGTAPSVDDKESAVMETDTVAGVGDEVLMTDDVFVSELGIPSQLAKRVESFRDQPADISQDRVSSRPLKPTPSAIERYSSLDTTNLEAMLSGGLDRFYGKFKKAWIEHDLSFPTPEINFEDLSYSVWLSNESPQAKSSIGGMFAALIAPWRKLKTVKKTILHPMSGVISPGTMTLILANPGSGKSTFLKAIAGKLLTRNAKLSGIISYSGMTAEEIKISKLVGLVDQIDCHFATLTVRETIHFADRCLNGPPEHQPPKLREVARLRTDLCLHILGLTKCGDTYVGDALLRGVSGGERKRVTLGEMLVGGQSVFLCDEISTGLDSAATFDITKSLKSWTRSLGGSAVVALLQPPPEVVELFDNVLVLQDGRLVYHGPCAAMLPYFQDIGFLCPKSVDPAEFVIDVVSGRGAQYLVQTSDALAKPPRRAIQFEDCFRKSALYKQVQVSVKHMRNTRQSVMNGDKLHSIAHLIATDNSGSKYGAGLVESWMLLLARQKKIWMRDKELVLGKIVEAVLVGLLLGIIYLNCKWKIYLRMLFFVVAIFQRQAWQQITISFQVRNVFYKQRSRHFFRTIAYTVAESMVQIPLNLVVSFSLCVIFYFMSGLSRTASTFIVFYVIVACFQHAISAYFTMLASISPSITIAQALASLSVSFFLLFSGNIILPKLIPDYWIWMHWFNPLAWALRSLILNEFHDARYSPTTRQLALKTFQVFHGSEFIWIGILVLIGYYILFSLLNTLALHYIQFHVASTASASAAASEDTYTAEEKTRASIVHNVVPDPSSLAGNENVVVNVPANVSIAETSGTYQFIPAYIAVQKLDYFVENPSGEGELQLLHGVTANFAPGTMTALMGSSGAGKTTFMDVLAGRKTGGRIVGDITVNGEPKDPATFSRIAGYCEQMDIHSGGASILEALEFAAKLRLPAHTTLEACHEIVTHTMELLELNGISRELVRNCSVEQKKRITIGVELVANPSILFLDEPTSGLDARSASFVMKGVLAIARTGRTVVCTIHQPSTQIFDLFDSLLLLQKGGHVAYFGELGSKSSKLISYLASIPGTPAIQPHANPATYMLEVIGAGIARGQARDYAVEYRSTDLFKANEAATAAITTGKIVDPDTEEVTIMIPFSPLHLPPIATGFWWQFRWCVCKMTMTYWRNPQYNLMRMVALPVYAVVFGTTFYKLTEHTSAAVNSHVGLMYNTLDFIGVINLMTVLDTVTSERVVFYRERMSNYYGPLPYAFSLFLAELPYLIWTSLLFMNVEYWLVGWEADAKGFFLFWFVFFMHITICTSVGQLMSVLMPNIKVANVAVGAMSVFFNLFSGFLMPHNSMRGFYKWIRWLVVTNYSLESLVSIELGRCGASEGSHHGCSNVTVTTGSTVTHSQLKNYIWTNYAFEFSNVGLNIGILVAILVIIQVAIYLTLRFVSHLKR